jgi:uncharacterized membrane protein
MWGMHDGMGWLFLYGSVWMVVFWGAIIGLAIWAINRSTSRNRNTEDNDESSLEIAKKRLARGDIDSDEFNEIVSLL